MLQQILAIGLSILHNLIVQQNYVSDLYPAKILDLSAKPFFPCRSPRATSRHSLAFSVN